MLNIEFRFRAHEHISQGRGGESFNVENENCDTCGEGCNGCNCENEMWGYDINTYEEVNLIEHVKSGKTGFDENWNVASEFTIDDYTKEVRVERTVGKRGKET